MGQHRFVCQHPLKACLVELLIVLLMPGLLSLPGCTTAVRPFKSTRAETGRETQVIQDLGLLPAPVQPIMVAVYKFRDQTGQYKQVPGTVNYSTAVTQGATAMLIKALEDAGRGSWFTILERETLPNLLNERKIIRQTRMQYLSDQQQGQIQALPPMKYAPLILDGGVIAYETNLLTGGIGAKYLGIGGDTQFQRDTVTVFLRLISVKDGRVIKSVETAKTIFSVKVDANVFKFIDFKQLLEAEVGFSSNEPPQLAVQEAIEQAVYSLIMEGAMSGLWEFSAPERAQPMLNAYLEEKIIKPVPRYSEDGELDGFERPEVPAGTHITAPQPGMTSPALYTPGTEEGEASEEIVPPEEPLQTEAEPTPEH